MGCKLTPFLIIPTWVQFSRQEYKGSTQQEIADVFLNRYSLKNMTTYFQYLQILGTTKSHILTNFTEAQAVFFISIYYISYGFFLLPYVLHRMEPYSASDVVVFHICVSVWNLKERGRCTILGFPPCLGIRQRCSLQKICQRLLGSTFLVSFSKVDQRLLVHSRIPF